MEGERETELGSQQAAEGQPNVSCRARLVNIPGERCKRPLYPTPTRCPPGAARQMRRGPPSEPAESPTNSHWKIILICYSHALKGPVPAYQHPHQLLCVCNLNVELVGGWAWVNASLWGTSLHLWSEISELFSHAEQKCFQYQTDAFVCVTLWGEMLCVSPRWISESSTAASPCAVSAIVYSGLMDMTP